MTVETVKTVETEVTVEIGMTVETVETRVTEETGVTGDTGQIINIYSKQDCVIGRAKRAPHRGVQSRFRVIYIFIT